MLLFSTTMLLFSAYRIYLRVVHSCGGTGGTIPKLVSTKETEQHLRYAHCNIDSCSGC